MPLFERICTAITLSTLLSYADNVASVGQATHNAKYLAFFVDVGPKYGYFPSLAKLFYVRKGKDEGIVKATFAARRLNVQFVRGHTYLGGFIGSGEPKKAWIEAKIATWVAAVGSLAKVAVNYPQTAYAGFAFCSQCK